MARIAVEPSALGGGADHAVFATHLIGAHRDREALAAHADQVEVRHGGLDHQHIRAFVEIELHLVESFAAVGGIHLHSPSRRSPNWGVGLGGLRGRGHRRRRRTSRRRTRWACSEILRHRDVCGWRRRGSRPSCRKGRRYRLRIWRVKQLKRRAIRAWSRYRRRCRRFYRSGRGWCIRSYRRR